MPNVVEILITATNTAGKAFLEAEASGTSMQKAITTAGAASAAALVATGVAATKMAADYETSTTRLVTAGGESQANIEKVRQGMLDMAKTVGTSAQELSVGMYAVESGGQHGADALTTLKAAAQGAKAEQADLTAVAKALTGVMNDYHEPATKAADITSQLIAAVAHGNTTLDAFTKAFGTVLPVAASAKVSFADVAGAMAQMTSHDMTARQASLDLAAAIKSLEAPNSAQAKEFKALGINAQEVQAKLGSQGLTATMEWLSQVVEKNASSVGQNYNEALKKVMGTSPAFQAALTSTGENYKAVTDAVNATAKATADAQGNVEGFAEVQKTLNFQLSQIKAQLETFMILLGQKIIPVVETLFKYIQDHATVFSELAKTIGLVIGALALFYTTTKVVEGINKIVFAIKAIVAATRDWAAIQLIVDGELVANPIGIIVVAIAALVGGIIYLWKTNEGFRNFFKTAWKDISGAVSETWTIIKEVFSAVVGFLKTAFSDIVKFGKAAWDDISGAAKSVWNAITGVFNDVKNFLAPIFEAIEKVANGVMTSISAWWQTHGQEIITLTTLIWNTIKDDLTDLYNVIIGVTRIAWDTITGIIKGEWTLISDTFKTIWQLIGPPLKEAWDMVASFTKAEWDIVAGIIGAVWDAIVEIVKLAWNTITDVISAAVKPIVALVTDGFNALESAIDFSYQSAIAIVKIAWDTIVAIVSVALDLVSGNWKQAWTDIKDFFTQVWDAITGFVKTATDDLKKIIEDVVHAVSVTWQAIQDILTAPFRAAYNDIAGIVRTISDMINSVTSGISSAWHTVGFAHGGVIGAATGGPRSGLTMVGEHGAELVKLPAGSRVYSNPDSERMLSGADSGGGTVTLVIQSDGGSYGEFLATELKKLARIRGGGNLQLAIVGKSA